MKSLLPARLFAMALLVSVAGCRSGIGGDGCSPGRPTITVVTLNLYHDRDDWPRRRGLILDGLREAEPDLIALQEVLQAPGLRNQAEDLAEALGYHYAFVSLDQAHQPRRYGNAVLSRHPIIERDEVALRPLDDYRSAARARVHVQGRPVDLIATHLHAGDEGGAVRAGQVRHLLEFSSRGDGHAAGVIVAGDFNAIARSPELRPMHVEFEDAYADVHRDSDNEPAAHATLNPAYFERPARIDHVFAQRGRFTACTASRILDKPDAAGAWASDHFGVLVRLGFADGAPRPE